MALDTGNNTYTASFNQTSSANALEGSDTLIVNWSAATGPIRWYDAGYGWQGYTDDAFSTIEHVNFEVFQLTGGTYADDLRGGDGADVLNGGAGDDTLSSGLGSDHIDGGSGMDRWVVNYSSLGSAIGVYLKTGGVTWTVPSTGLVVKNIEELEITTGAGADSINTSLLAGNDVINTGAGDDTIASGLGIDTINAGDGTDYLSLNFSTQTENVQRSDIGYGWMRYQAGDEPSAQTDYYSVERFSLTGGAGHDQLYGGALNDVLVGNAGDDYLNGAAGIDQIDGGLGKDTWAIDYSSLLNVSVDLNSVADVTTGYQSASTSAKFKGIEQLNVTTGSGNDVIRALVGAFNDVVSTGGGDDSVSLSRGKDSLNAGENSATGDQMILDWSAVSTNISWSDLGYGWARYSSLQADQADFIGVERFNLTGGSGADDLRGGGGADTLVGGSGNDWLRSSAGNATVDGGVGTDYWQADLSASIANIMVNTSSGQTTAQGGSGSGLSILDIEGLSLVTGAGNDNLSTNGYATDDTVETRAGNDTVNLGLGVNRANGGDGEDTLTVSYSSLTSAVTRVDEGYGWFGYYDKLGTTSTSFYGFEKFNLTGGSASDNLIGGALSDSLSGGLGNDILNGGAGVDTISGGAGNDRWVADYSALTTNLSLTMNSTGGGTLTGSGTTLSGIESITLTTSSAIANDAISTLAIRGNDVINTQAGDDTVRVGAGVHQINGGVGSDLLQFDFSSSVGSITGRDMGYGWYKYADSAALNSVNFYGFESYKITGGAGGDRLYTWSGSDNINGGAGDDILNAGSENDYLTGGIGSDIFVCNVGNGTDRITDASAGDVIRITGAALNGSVNSGNGTTLTSGQVQLAYSATTNTSTLYIGTNSTAGADVSINLTGNYATSAFALAGQNITLLGNSSNGTAGDDSLLGTSGNDTLSGGVGNDALDGLAGNDSLSGGDGIDTLTGNLGADKLSGGIGADVFKYVSANDSTSGTVYHDIISDFSTAQGDKIDLSDIDANPVLAGDQAFAFRTTAFSGGAGQLHFYVDATLGQGIVAADINGDAIADIEIALVGVTTMAITDFVL